MSLWKNVFIVVIINFYSADKIMQMCQSSNSISYPGHIYSFTPCYIVSYGYSTCGIGVWENRGDQNFIFACPVVNQWSLVGYHL